MLYVKIHIHIYIYTHIHIHIYIYIHIHIHIYIHTYIEIHISIPSVCPQVKPIRKSGTASTARSRQAASHRNSR